MWNLIGYFQLERGYLWKAPMGRMQSIQTVKKTYSQFLRSVRQPSRRSLTSGAKKRHHSKHVHPVTLAEHLQERVVTLLHFIPKLHLPPLACRGTFCSFSARTCLYRIFKLKEGCTPTEWREKLAENAGAWDKSPTVAGRVRNSWFPSGTKSRGWKWRYVVKS